MITDDFQIEALKVGLRQMFSQGHFSICHFDHLCELASVEPPPRLKKSLHVLHCVNYSEMSPKFREELYKNVLGVFSAENQLFDLSVIDGEPTILKEIEVKEVVDKNGRPSWWRRALGS